MWNVLRFKTLLNIKILTFFLLNLFIKLHQKARIQKKLNTDCWAAFPHPHTEKQILDFHLNIELTASDEVISRNGTIFPGLLPLSRIPQLLCCSFPSLLPWCWPSPPQQSVSWISYSRSWSHCHCSQPYTPAPRGLRLLTPRTLVWPHCCRQTHPPDPRESLSAPSPQAGLLLPGYGCCIHS